MKKIFLLTILFFGITPVQAGLYDDILGPNNGSSILPPPVDIDYGYNAVGDYVPTAVDNQRIQYGYNAMGDFVPTSVGGQQIHYGYNAYGEFVPMSIGD